MKKSSALIKETICLILLLVCFTFHISCADDKGVIKTTHLDFTAISEIHIEKTKGIEAIYDNGATVDLEWSSTDDSILTINPITSQTAEIKGLKVGVIQIVLTDKISGLSVSKDVYVCTDIEEIHTKSVNFNTFNRIILDDEKVVTAKYDENAIVDFEWTSSNENVLTVTKNNNVSATVKGISVGTSNLKLKDNKSGLVKEITVEVFELKKANITFSTFKLLSGTAYETPVYKYVTDLEGPKIAIIGGIHGDEVAGWTAGLTLVEKLKEERGICGEILLVPQVNILADLAKSRYSVSGYNFSDLNRSFPLDRYATATTQSITISTAIVNLVEGFNPDYIIDLHESQHSWVEMESGTTTSLGDTLIAGNQNKFMRQLIKHYNENYRPTEETEFRQEGANQKGSFNYYFTNTYPDKVVFTIETNRLRISGVDTIDLDIRVRQQLNVLEALLDFAWERI